MESGSLLATSNEASANQPIMLRAVLLSFAMLAAQAAACSAPTTQSADWQASLSENHTPNSAPTVARNASPNRFTTEQPAPTSNSAAGSSSGEDSAAENELLQFVNKSRKLAGVPPLRMDASLHAAALAHGQRIIAAQKLDHQFAGELPLLERVAEVSPLRLDRAGENLANATCAPDAHEVLMNSPPHRANLLDRNFNVVGIVAIRKTGRLYVVQDFAHELPSYSGQESARLIAQSLDDLRQQAGLPDLIQFKPPHLDDAACSLANEDRPNAHMLAAAYTNRKIITYTQSRPEVLPQGAARLLRDPGVGHFAVGACYARNTAYPTGTYWVAILLY
jgi:uncharacterized protein YkwD